MRKIVLISLLVIATMISCKFYADKVFAEDATDNESELIITLLTPYITNAIQDYYGELRQFDLFNANIESIEKDSRGKYTFEVKIQIITFVGPHNPPHGYDTLSFTVTPSSVKLDKYEHRNEVF